MRGHPEPREGSRFTGTFVSLRDTVSAEIAATAGFDIVFVDLEHAVVPYSAGDYVRAVEAGGASPWIRCDHTLPLQPWLDAGVQGVLFSRCTSGSQARGMVERVAWPPLGARGLAASARVGGYGGRPVDFAAPATPALVGVIIEDHAGCDAAEEILSTEGVSLVVVGLTDLGIALAAGRGLSGDELTKTIADEVVRVADIAAANGVTVGLPYGHPMGGGPEGEWTFSPGLYLAGSDVTALTKGFAAARSALGGHVE